MKLELTRANELQVKLERKRKVAKSKKSVFAMFDELMYTLQKEYDSKHTGSSFAEALEKLEDAFGFVLGYLEQD